MARSHKKLERVFHSLRDGNRRAKQLASDVSRRLKSNGVSDYLYLRNKCGDRFDEDIPTAIVSAELFVLYVDRDFGSTTGTKKEVKLMQQVVDSRDKTTPGVPFLFVVMLKDLPNGLHPVPITAQLISGLIYLKASEGARSLASSIIKRLKTNNWKPKEASTKDYSLQERNRLVQDVLELNFNGRIAWNEIESSVFWKNRSRDSRGLRLFFFKLKKDTHPTFLLTTEEKESLQDRDLM